MLWPNGKKTQPKVVSHFGPRVAPGAGASTNHKGTDFVGFTQVKAVAAGRVSGVGTPSGWAGGGNQVWIQHDGFLARYLHLAKGSQTVKVGQLVKEGETIGIMGATGVAFGIHLHLEIVVNGVQINPVPFIKAGIKNGNKPVPVKTDYTKTLNSWGNMGIQKMLKKLYGYKGPIDGIFGVGSTKAFQRFLKANYASTLVIDGIFGPATAKATQVWLRRKWGYTHAIDGIFGPGTKAAWRRADASNKRAF